MNASVSYGQELILDLHNCKFERVVRGTLRTFFNKLCDLIEMEKEDIHFWDYEGLGDEYKIAPIHLKGTSAIQFIRTSNITIHTLDDLKCVYLNIFSCKPFDRKTVEVFTKEYFKGVIVQSIYVERK